MQVRENLRITASRIKLNTGIALEPVSIWEFGTDSYVTAEYP